MSGLARIMLKKTKARVELMVKLQRHKHPIWLTVPEKRTAHKLIALELVRKSERLEFLGGADEFYITPEGSKWLLGRQEKTQ